MKPVQLTLICHGQTEAQRVGRFALDDDPLRELPAPMAGLSTGAHCLSAPELRALQTAQGLGLQATVDERLRDCDLGRWQGLALKQLQHDDLAGLQAWLADPQSAPHGGESVAALCSRVAHWLDSDLAAGEWLVITHPFVIRAAMLHALAAPLDAFQRIDVQPLAQVRLSHSTQWRLQLPS